MYKCASRDLGVELGSASGSPTGVRAVDTADIHRTEKKKVTTLMSENVQTDAHAPTHRRTTAVTHSVPTLWPDRKGR